VRILGLSGSLRRDSYNTALLRAAAEELPPGATLEIYDGLRDVPPYDADLEDEAPEAVKRLREAISSADALLLATPEYNGSISGVLKNAIDWASRPKGASSLDGKPAAVVGASTGLFGAVWAQAELRKVLDIAGAEPLEGEVPVGQAHHALDEQGRLKDPDLRQALRERVRQLVERASTPAVEAA